MARANLNISTQINEEFLRANESNDVRILKVKIEEEDLVLDGVVNKVSTVQEDFNSVLPASVQDNQASFILIRITDEVFDSCVWALIAWVPDGCRVRDKMLYSSSREDLKRSIGLSFLKAEYAANTRSDLTWEQFKRSQDKTVTSDLFTESERLVLEEKQQVLAESTTSKSSALSVLPFQLSTEVTEKMNDFQSGECNWVEMTVCDEVIKLLGYRTVQVSDSFQSYIDNETASFIAVRLPRDANHSVTVLIYSCPENCPVRVKMTMSSSKASVIAAAQKIGVNFDKTLEIRDADEVNSALHSILFPESLSRDSPNPDGTNNNNNVSSAAANISHSKPTRPGRTGRVKINKFKVEDEI